MSDTATVDKTAIRHAATTIILRGQGRQASVLMGMRGKSAAFMPEKFVFPGGALDPCDALAPVHRPLEDATARRLAAHSEPGLGAALAAAAIRETWEETGLILGAPGEWSAPPQGWRGFAATGHVPALDTLTFVFRAITPAGRPRRFDARFFLASADSIIGDPDDFSRACDELSDLQWVPLADARRFNLPFITELVLAEVARVHAMGEVPASVPFFDNSGPQSVFRRLA